MFGVGLPELVVMALLLLLLLVGLRLLLRR